MNEKFLKDLKIDISLSDPKKRCILLSFLFVVALVIRLFYIDNSLTQEIHDFRQTQTAITVQCYFNDGWSFFNYETPLFGAPWNVIFECPIYQSIVYFFMKITGMLNIDIGCRIVSIIMFMLSAVMLYRFCRLITGKLVISVVVYSLYLFLPYNIYWSRAALIDYTSVLFGLIYACGLTNWLYNEKNASYIIALFFGVLAYLQKSTSMFPVIAMLGMLILKYYYVDFKKSGADLKKYISKIRVGQLILLVIICIVPVVSGYLWVRYSDESKSDMYYLRNFTSEALKDWNYGTLSQKFSIRNWDTIVNRLKDYSCGAFILFYVVIVCLSPSCRKLDYASVLLANFKKDSFLILSNIVAILFTVFILFNLYYVHNYYIIALTPYLSILTGIMIYDIVSSAAPHIRSIGITAATVLTILVGCFSGSENLIYLDYAFHERKEPKDIWNYISDITTPDDRIIIEGNDWTSEFAYKMNRKCFMLIAGEDDSYFAKNIFPYDNYSVILAENPARLKNTLSECSLVVGRLGFSAYMAEILQGDISDVAKNADPVMCENDLYSVNAESSDWIVFSRKAGDSKKYCITVTLSDGNMCDCSVFFPEGADTAVYSPTKLGSITAVSCEEDITGVSVYKFDLQNQI